MDPQSWNRYAYTLNNPVRYTDPTGHMVSDEGGGGDGIDNNTKDETADEVVTQDSDGDIIVTPVTTGENQYPNGKECWPNCIDNGEDKASACLNDPSCVLDLIIPTHGGLRSEFSAGFGFPVLGPVGIGPNVTVGASFMCNRKSWECGGAFDVGAQLAIQGSGCGASITAGTLMGWGASSLAPVLGGYSANLGGEGCALFCGEASVSMPMNSRPGPGGIPVPDGPYGDPNTGFIPATVYIGGGFGGAIPEGIRVVGGVGGGLSFSWAEIISVLPK